MSSNTIHDLLDVCDEVAAAQAAGQPVVALESNVISNGLPHPQNLETVDRMEQEVRDAGAIPAVIAIDRGRLLVGLSTEQKQAFAERRLPKVGSRDIPAALASGTPAVTTVSASLAAAELAGVRFFASAGLGGVHRRAETTFDISSDLVQLTRSRVVAVTAGVKTILDIGLTLEFLETQCVPCVSFKFNEFPGFYVRNSGFRAPCRIDDLTELARAIQIHDRLGHGGFLVTAPTRPEDALDAETVEAAIAGALDKAQAEGVQGKAVTNFVMRAVNAATGGLSDLANAAVLVSNARFAAELAVEHAALAARPPRERSAA